MSKQSLTTTDAYLVPVIEEDEDSDWCDYCSIVASACEQPEEHAASWLTYSEHMQAQADDWASESWAEEWE